MDSLLEKWDGGVRMEQGQPVTVNLMDFVRNPLDRSTVATLIRLYDIIPEMEITILNELKDRLDNGNLYVQKIKKDYPRIIEFLTPASRKNAMRYNDDEAKHNCKTVVGELSIQQKIFDDLIRDLNSLSPPENAKPFTKVMAKHKRTAWLKRFISMLAIYEGISDIESLEDFKREVMDRAIPMGQLEVGDQFMFANVEHEMDAGGQMFTYVGMFEEDIPGNNKNKNVVTHYRKVSDSMAIIYIEQNPFRPVIPLPKTCAKGIYGHSNLEK